MGVLAGLWVISSFTANTEAEAVMNSKPLTVETSVMSIAQWPYQGSHNFLKFKFMEFQGGILTNFKEILDLPDPNSNT